MTNPEAAKVTASPTRKPRRNSPADKIWAAGLAAATCIGIVGVVGVRTVEANAADVAAAQSATTDIALMSSSEPTTSTGLTQADLDAYAAELNKEAAKLTAYRAALVDAANALQAGSGQVKMKQLNVQQPTIKKIGATSRPAAQAAPRPAPAPQSNTKSS